ncbi:ABC transporter ATP-binding protein [Brachybacterium sp. DNPG3]
MTIQTETVQTETVLPETVLPETVPPGPAAEPGSPEPGATEPAAQGIRAEDVGVVLRRREILRAIALEARAGEVTALVGPNGSGKSTFLRTLFSAVPATGSVRVGGEELRSLPARARVERLAVLTQERDFAAGTRTREVVAVGRSARRPVLQRADAEDARRIAEAMAQVGIVELAERDIATLSGGERQRAHIARVMAQDAAVVVMDEPTNHLDIGHQVAALALLRQLAREEGRTVLVALHDLALAARWADRTVVLEAGRAIAAGRPREILVPELIASCFGVDSRWIELDGEERLIIG